MTAVLYLEQEFGGAGCDTLPLAYQSLFDNGTVMPPPTLFDKCIRQTDSSIYTAHILFELDPLVTVTIKFTPGSGKGFNFTATGKCSLYTCFMYADS